MTTPKWAALALAVSGCAAAPKEIPTSSAPKAAAPGVVRDLAYGEAPQQRLDLLLPDDMKGEPLVVFVHGGAWQGGSRSEYDAVASAFQGKGLAAATVDYRLSPGVRHPAHAEDVAHALAWLRGKAKTYGYDPQRIFVVGHSAGGHIAGTIATTPALLALAKPAGFVGLEGIYDLPSLARRWPTYPGWFLDHAFGSDQATWPAASPTRRKVVGRAPWLVVHSTGDELVDVAQADGFVAHLRSAGVPVRVIKPTGESHGGVVQGLSKPKDGVAEAILAFVKRRP